MRSVQILMSTYNGEGRIRRQIDSILAQTGVDIHLLIRDDGSQDATMDIIHDYSEKYPDKLTIISGGNLGFEMSFYELCRQAGDYDYYGFADQDDYWFVDKVSASIARLEADDYSGVKLVQTKEEYSDADLKPLPEQQYRPTIPRSRMAAIADDYFKGCAMLWNAPAMRLLQRHLPSRRIGSHDYWTGLVCTLAGRIYFVDEVKFFHVRYGDNSSTDGSMWASRLRRVKLFLNGSQDIYHNPASELLAGYSDFLAKNELALLTNMARSRTSILARLRLLRSSELRRSSLLATVFMKFVILLGRY